jgi:hypothetical protein
MTTAAELLERHGEALAHNLGHDVYHAAEEICRSLAESGNLPEGVDARGAFQVIMSLRATLELMAVEHRFGEQAHDVLLRIMDAYYSRTLLAGGSFIAWIAAAHETMRRSERPREWMRIHAENVLGTREPEAALFHVALGYGYHVGASIATVIEENIAAE